MAYVVKLLKVQSLFPVNNKIEILDEKMIHQFKKIKELREG